MASSEVASETFQPGAIYVLDKTLNDCAGELEFFLKQKCEINVCDKEHWETHIGYNIEETSENFDKCPEKKLHTYKVDSTVVSICDYGDLERLKTKAKREVDVIIILGHSSALLAEDKDLIETFAKLDPTIIAFVGCCGGNTRYGPILNMSYLLPAPIIAFYQRQVYKDELKYTSLMIGLRNYLHVYYGNEVGDKVDRLQSIQKIYRKKVEAKCAFALAKLDESLSPTDPTVFINDRVNDRGGINPVQMILNKCDLKTAAVPLSCMQLAMYSPMVVDPKESFEVEAFKQEPPIILSKHSCLEHKLIIDDVLWQLDHQKIEITLHGNTQTDIKNEKYSRYAGINIEILGTSLKEITISEGLKNIETPHVVESKDLILPDKTIKVTLRSPQQSEKNIYYINKDKTDKIKISLQAQPARSISILKKGEQLVIEINYELQPPKYHHDVYMRTKSIRQDEKEIRIIPLYHHPCDKITIDELSKVCWKKIGKLQLHKIIPLICEIKFIKLFKKSLELLKTGDKSSLEKIDPLQFLVAVLRGHWGKNSLTVIKEWATYHLNSIKGKVEKDKPEVLHNYKLCCMCFVLLFEDSFVRFVKPNEKYDQCGIIVCTKHENNLVDVTLPPDAESPNSCDRFPDDGELAGWVCLFQCCDYNPELVYIYNNNNPDYLQYTWTIGNHYRTPNEQMDTYQYSCREFLLCLGALSDRAKFLSNHIDVKKSLRQSSYNVKKFYNEDNEYEGHTEYFDTAKILADIGEDHDIIYTETKLLLNSNGISKIQNFWFQEYRNDPATQHVVNREVLQTVITKSQLNWKKVSSCRFVFAQFVTWPVTLVNNTITGILFYTDTHYGHNLIVFNQKQLDNLCNNCSSNLPIPLRTPYEQRKEKVSERDWVNGSSKLCHLCRYKMINITITEIKDSENRIFPFVKVGRLTLTYNGGRQLTEIRLDHCAERTCS